MTSLLFTTVTTALVSLAPYLAVTAFLLALVALVAFTLLERRLVRLTRGKGGSLEEALEALSQDVKELTLFRKEIEKYLKVAEMRLRGSVQGVGIVRFNPFHGEGQGGNQSFAAAFLDEYGSGVVFSTLYARDRVGVYAKPLEESASPYELTTEEREAIERAKESIASHKKK